MARTKKSTLIKIAKTILVTFLIIYVGLFLSLLQEDNAFLKGIIHDEVVWVDSNQDDLWYAFTEAFPHAATCTKPKKQCIKETRDIIDKRLHRTLSYSNSDYNRLPLFFIRLKDENTIEKLYQSGDYMLEPVDTNGERMVVEMLQGKRDPFSYPQYKCCGGDDLVAGYPILGHLLPTRTYLLDFQSEVELILLMRDGMNKIQGAIVYHYGD